MYGFGFRHIYLILDICSFRCNLIIFNLTLNSCHHKVKILMINTVLPNFVFLLKFRAKITEVFIQILHK